MEVKKSNEADLEKKKFVFLATGLVMASALVLMAFTVTSADIKEKVAETDDRNRVQEEFVFEIPPEQPEPPQEQEVAPPPPDLEEIDIKDDEEEIEELDLTKFEEEKEPEEKKEEVKIVEEPIADFAEVEPAFPGGDAAMAQFIQKNVVYPELAKEMGEQGTVYVQFVVNSNGSIQDVVVIKSVSDLLDKEAIRVVKKMPAWSPGEQAGKKVRVRFTLPINFKIA